MPMVRAGPGISRSLPGGGECSLLQEGLHSILPVVRRVAVLAEVAFAEDPA